MHVLPSPPTSSLPLIAKILSYSAQDLVDAIERLRFLYNPPVRGSRRRHLDDAKDELPGSSKSRHQLNLSSSNSDLDALRSDPFERSYAIKWLTTLICQMESESEPSNSSTRLILSSQDREDLIQKSASLLAICAGTAAAGPIFRVFTFDSSIFPEPIEVQLRDVPLENGEYSSVGAQTWGGACVLSETIVEHPHMFGLDPHTSQLKKDSRHRRVLELGAGTGLVSLTFAKLLQRLGHRPATIIATDFYPSVLTNLQSNFEQNFPSTKDFTVSLSVHRLDWSSFPSATEPREPALEQPFDLILGADIVYEAQHALWIKACLAVLLRRKENNQPNIPFSEAIFHLVIPLRSTHTFESSTIEDVFPLQRDAVADQAPIKHELVIKSKETIFCDADNHTKFSTEGVEYAYYKIGWS